MQISIIFRFGVELLKVIQLFAPQVKLKYWRDHAGPEVDYVIEYNRQLIAIAVKWTTAPSKTDAKHLFKFINEYDCMKPAYIICRTPKPVEISENILAISWEMMPNIIRQLLEN